MFSDIVPIEVKLFSVKNFIWHLELAYLLVLAFLIFIVMPFYIFLLEGPVIRKKDSSYTDLCLIFGYSTIIFTYLQLLIVFFSFLQIIT
jgi:hypothetical protein